MRNAQLLLFREETPSPIGGVIILSDQAGVLRAVDFEDCEQRVDALLDRQYGKGRWEVTRARRRSSARLALQRYFEGETRAIDGLATQTAGTAFQQAVWRQLKSIPCGATMSYAALAMAIGAPRSTRPVGQANGANPIAIVIPCHRVIGASGDFTGYGGGIKRKRWLLEHEAACQPQQKRITS
jgi:methylated-DNA-[protein]-cysteine S-methyltransferase